MFDLISDGRRCCSVDAQQEMSIRSGASATPAGLDPENIVQNPSNEPAVKSLLSRTDDQERQDRRPFLEARPLALAQDLYIWVLR
jgi:hypothetical protein